MRILHTADWHVGRTIRGHSRADEHRAVLAEIAGLAAEQDVDLVLIAGDLFDTAAPSAAAEHIVYRALLDLAATGAEVVLIAGNHDNPRRWGAIAPLLHRSGVHAAAALRRPADGGVIEISTRAGQTARVALVPFISQRAIVKVEHLMALDSGQHASQYAERCKLVLAAMADQFTSQTVNLIVAHLTVASGAPALGGGERMAHTIFDYFVTPQAFPVAAHYGALGHLHLPQRVPGPAPLWYSGSPLALDFGEAERADKAVLLIDVAPDAPARVRELPLRCGRRLRTLRGGFDELLAQRADINPDAYLRIQLDERPQPGLARAVREAFPQAVDVAVTAAAASAEAAAEPRDVHGSPQQLFARYLADHGGSDAALERLFARLLEEEYAANAS